MPKPATGPPLGDIQDLGTLRVNAIDCRSLEAAYSAQPERARGGIFLGISHGAFTPQVRALALSGVEIAHPHAP
ncbi:hypothetical protein RYZ27_02000 [Hyphomonas sp. FCG-A18]|uniref:hypothetical protein n=1 Tax=Hyphomonas sp. FCG-A18 TaxID=3080019 RepID=UPI002B300C6E|nr:hypothetical protein RYZ27_02000 [Hyphomonas sp. FCG-A18]